MLQTIELACLKYYQKIICLQIIYIQYTHIRVCVCVCVNEI